MAYTKIEIKPGVNRENTRYTTEGGWYETEKVRFRQGYPEKIGGWQRLSANTFLGVCRSMWNWVTLAGQNLVALGTDSKYYVERGGAYYDITPLRATTAAGDVTFAAATGDETITVTDTAHGALAGDYVTFSGAVTLGGVITADVLNIEYMIATIVDDDNYTVEASVAANASDTGDGGASVVGAYQINVGNEYSVPATGYGAGPFGLGLYGYGAETNPMRLWSQANFGEDLVFAYREGAMYYWDASAGTSTRAVNVTTLSGASDVPTVVNYVFVSDIYRFGFAFGCNELGSATLDPMLIRWSAKENLALWTPAVTNEAGDLRVSHGSEIITAMQARQEILVWTDSALYGLQYLGSPDLVWGAQLVGDNISIAGQNATAYSGGVAYWMGRDKFYTYTGVVQTLPCNVRRYVFNDFNPDQYEQVVAGVNEGFHEIWWFYCSAGETAIDRYVVYNYVANIWYYGTMARTAWLDSGLRRYPMAATYNNKIVYHEIGVDDDETGTPAAIEAYATSSEVDIGDGDRFMFIRKVLPDITFDGSTADSPSAVLTLTPMKDSSSGYTSPASVGGENEATVTRSATVPIEAFTGDVAVRVRGRQLVVKIESTSLGVTWQLGSPRFDMRQDGRRG